jgi:peptidyl-Lys metalloendopeptidase
MIFVILSLFLSLSLAQFDVSIAIEKTNPLTLNFTVFNPLDTPQTFLQWGTPFEGVWTDMFDIRDENGMPVTYTGMIVRRGEQPIPEEFLTVAPGEHLTAWVNLEDNYEFVSAGKYHAMLSLPIYSELFISAVGDQVVDFEVDTIPPKKVFPPAPLAWTNCNSQQTSQGQSAVSGSVTECSRAYNCLSQGSCDTQYTRWFGTRTTDNHNYVTVCYRNVHTRLTGSTFNGYCNPAGCGSNVYGYVYPTDSTYTVYLCALFWSRADERVNTIVHEMSHFRTLAGTNDYAYGQTACLNLARSNPSQASRNADNICYFSASV